MDAIRIARAATGPRHDREDLRLLPRPPRLRDGLDRRRVRPDRRPLRPRTRSPTALGIPQAVVGHDGRGAVQRRRGDGAADRATRRGGPRAGLRDHGAGDDEPRRRAARARLPRGGARDHAQARRPAHLRRGQDRPLHRGRRRASSASASRPTSSRSPRRSAAGCPSGAIGGTAEAFELVEAGKVVQVGTYNGNPLSMAAARANLLEVLTPDAYAHLDALNDHLLVGCQMVIDEVLVPGLLGRHRLEGVRHVLTRADHRLRDVQGEPGRRALRARVALQHEPRHLHDARPRGGVDALDHALLRGLRPVRGGVRGDGRRPDRVAVRGSPRPSTAGVQ